MSTTLQCVSEGHNTHAIINCLQLLTHTASQSAPIEIDVFLTGLPLETSLWGVGHSHHTMSLPETCCETQLMGIFICFEMLAMIYPMDSRSDKLWPIIHQFWYTMQVILKHTTCNIN